MNKIYFILFLQMLALAFPTFAQDIPFAQYQNVPMALSPALTGVMQDNHRLTSSIRRQWNSIRNTRAWEQTYFSYDTRRCVGTDFFAFGFQAQADRMGLPSLSNFIAAINIAYHHKVGNELYLSAGVSGGVFHYRINREGMTFDEQFGSEGFNSMLPSFEDFENDNRTTYDLSAGLLLFNPDENWTAGFALYHLNQPHYSFLRADENRLGVGFSIHGSISLKLSEMTERSRLIVRSLYRRQSTIDNSRQWFVLTGVTWQYAINKVYLSPTIGTGLSFRLSGHVEGQAITTDALVPAVYFNFDQLSIGFSYDINVSNAAKESHLRGGWEVSVAWQWLTEKGKGCVLCPEL